MAKWRQDYGEVLVGMAKLRIPLKADAKNDEGVE